MGRCWRKRERERERATDRQADGQGETNTDCHTEPYFPHFLTILHCIIFKAPLSTSSTSRPSGGYSTEDPLWAALWDATPAGRTTTLWRSPWLSLLAAIKTYLRLRHHVSHVGICIYHFITPNISVQPRNCFRFFSLVYPVLRISYWRFGQGSVRNKKVFFILQIFLFKKKSYKFVALGQYLLGPPNTSTY